MSVSVCLRGVFLPFAHNFRALIASLHNYLLDTHLTATFDDFTAETNLEALKT